MVKYGLGGDNVIISQMGYYTIKTEDLEQELELVGFQARSNDTCELDGIEKNDYDHSGFAN